MNLVDFPNNFIKTLIVTKLHFYGVPNFTLKVMPSKPANEECVFVEMIQYQCEIGTSKIICSPFSRIFKICSGRPTVEVTSEFDQYGNPTSGTRTDSNANTPETNLK